MTLLPLGAHADARGVDFAVYSSVADGVDLCLFDGDGAERRVPLSVDEGFIWRGRVDGIGDGALYGFRVTGPWDPSRGLRCNPAKLLLDPYARAIAGGVTWAPAVRGDDPADSAQYVPRSVVHAREFDWRGDAAPGVALADSIIYELHVKGYTKLHPEVPEELRGTYRGLAHPAVTDHLRKLGVTAVELLPVHQFVHDGRLLSMGLRNYWGYQSIGYFAPHNEYGTVDDFKEMVRGLHAAGLEVILDVVFNHTAEGNEQGPALCFRGLDNAAYYRLAADPQYYVDDTGCGNTFDASSPPALRLVMDSLRYWIEEMHVDGFRFDLAAALGRSTDGFDPHSAFLETVGQDPVVGSVKLIAEPWDWGSYALGDFPAGWSEWNGRYRDTVRDFWRSTAGRLADFATRVTGSADLYGRERRPTSSINLVTVHDGFTLADLTAYDEKHNEANGEDNRDGTDDNRSWNCGVEGSTDDSAVLSLRAQQRRNFLATLLLSDGVPLLLGGDELSRTQRGNNNAYCQDDEISWVDWSSRGAAGDLTEFVAGLIEIRSAHPGFRRRTFFTSGELIWLRPDGEAMTDGDWSNPIARAVAVVQASTNVIVLFNAYWEPLTFALPVGLNGTPLSVLVDTSTPSSANELPGAPSVVVAGRSLLVASAR